MSRILLIDDEPSILSVLTTLLKAEGHDVVSSRGGEKAQELVRNDPFDLMISSGTFQHISPDFGAALVALRPFLRGAAVFDLPDAGDDSSAIDTSQVFVRRYNRAEISATLQQCDFRLAGLIGFDMATVEFSIDPSRLVRRDVLSLQDGQTALVHRLMVVAET